jgi:hypothetical protein
MERVNAGASKFGAAGILIRRDLGPAVKDSEGQHGGPAGLDLTWATSIGFLSFETWAGIEQKARPGRAPALRVADIKNR